MLNSSSDGETCDAVPLLVAKKKLTIWNFNIKFSFLLTLKKRKEHHGGLRFTRS